MVCGSFVCIYRSQCECYQVYGIDACYGLSDSLEGECVNFHCQACENTYCNTFLQDIDFEFDNEG